MYILEEVIKKVDLHMLNGSMAKYFQFLVKMYLRVAIFNNYQYQVINSGNYLHLKYTLYQLLVD